MMEEQRGRQWHLDKSISVGHLLTTLLIAGSVFTWALKIDTRISIIETKQEQSKEDRVRIEKQNSQNYAEIKDTLIRIEAKIDRKRDR